MTTALTIRAKMRTVTITVAPMRDIPVGLRARMRTLSLGPIAWGFWSWTFQDGSCWAALMFDGDATREDALIGWAALTEEMDMLPVVGVFVAEEHRRRGHANALMTTLLQRLVAEGVLGQGDAVFNSSWRWSKYDKVIESCGLRSLAWK